MCSKNQPLGAGLLWFCVVLSLSIGCQNAAYEGFQPPSISSSTAAGEALESYDTNGDGSLDNTELSECPAILANLSNYDTDGNEAVSRDELAARFNMLFSDGATFTNVACTIKKSGRPVAGAKVKFVPEAFLGDGILPSEGVSDRSGRAIIAVADEHVPKEFLDRNVMQVAIYRVEVDAGGKIALFGHEVDFASREGANPTFDLDDAK
jgi:hypothetical protein